MVQAEDIIQKAEERRKRRRELLRPVAEFFHDNEGTLFERYEAVNKLIESDEIDFGDERILHQVISNLASDRVDPVQNIVNDSKKLIGVIEYTEHDYWYEYVGHDDINGRVNVGVCAQCVKEKTSDTNVAKGIGTTEELSEKIHNHYKKNHTESPNTVSTGATLVSGTNVAGNKLIHTGNDGTGSGLDADKFRGNNIDNVLTENTPRTKTESKTLNQLTKFNSPCFLPAGIGFDSQDSIWHAENETDKIYQINQSGTIQSSFSAQSSGPIGIGVDSNDCIWNSDVFINSIYKLDQSGNRQSKFSSPGPDPNGIGIDSTNSIWNGDEGNNSIYQLNQSGSIQSSFASPSSGLQGIGVDSDDSIWSADLSESIYELNQSGSIQSKFSSPASSPRGIGIDSQNSIWNTDFSTNNIYELIEGSVFKYE